MEKVLNVLLVPTGDSPPVLTQIPNTADALREAIGGGDLEGFGFHSENWSGYLDEEGKFKHLPVNERACALAWELGWPKGDFLVGPVLFLGPPDDEGYDTDVTPIAIDTARTLGLLDMEVPNGLRRTTITVWYDPALYADDGDAKDNLIEAVNLQDGVEFVTIGHVAESAATYDRERGVWEIPDAEIPAGVLRSEK